MDLLINTNIYQYNPKTANLDTEELKNLRTEELMNLRRRFFSF